MKRHTTWQVILAATLLLLTACSSSAGEPEGPRVGARDGAVVFKVVMVADESGDPAAAGKTAASELKAAMETVPLKAVIVSECFEDKENKQKLLDAVCSVLGKEAVFGSATYGSFTQNGCADFDSVCLLGIGGDGIDVSAALVTELGTATLTFDEHQARIESLLHKAGQQLAKQLPRSDADRLLLLIPDAHSPKNQYLVEGVQQVLGKQFPMTGGSANKNAGQTFVYFRGQMYHDSALALMLSGRFQVAMAGRQAKTKETVIQSAGDGAAAALAGMKGEPIAVLAYNCAGRRSKLQDFGEELTAIQKSLGTSLTLFGCYNAGEIGPIDGEEKDPAALCGGSGWHVMFTVIGK